MNLKSFTALLLPYLSLAAFWILTTRMTTAQDFPYTMTQLTEPYVPLAQYLASLPGERFATDLIQGDDRDDALPDFEFAGNRVDTIKIYPRGLVGLYTTGKGWTGQISALPCDWVPRSVHDASDRSSNLGLTVDGAKGSRILKIEWKNLTLPSDNPGDVLDSANYQLWIYEGSGVMEVRVGPNSVISQFTDWEQPVSGPSLGLIQPPAESIPEPKGVFYTGNPAAPAHNPWHLGIPFGYLEGFPDEGTVYRFTFSGSAGVDQGSSVSGGIVACPNPAGSSTAIHFTLDRAATCKLLLHNALGEINAHLNLGRMSPGEQSVRLSTGGLPAGLYFYTLEIGDKRVTESIAVQ
jgi:hypothetical protein